MHVPVREGMPAGESLTVGFPAAAALLLFAGSGVGENQAPRPSGHSPSAPAARPTVKPILLDYGSTDPLVLEPSDADVAFDARGPAGVMGDAAAALAGTAIDTPGNGPPLVAYVVPGDRVALALAGPIPAVGEIVATIRSRLESAGIAADDLAILHAPPLISTQPPSAATSLPAGEFVFDPTLESGSAFLGPDAEGIPLQVARTLVDADVVVTVGVYAWDAALGGLALDGDLWPAFAPGAARADVLRHRSREIGWQLGTIATLRVVPGRGGTAHAIEFGTPLTTDRAALRHAQLWRPRLPGSPRLTIASLAAPESGMPALVRAVAAAARTTHPEGTICIASRLATPPGPVFYRWRQGVALKPLVEEALASGDQTLVADAVATRFFAQALGDRRLVLLSDLDQGLVEELEFGHAATPEAVERLAHRAESFVVLHEAERMFPRLG